MRATLLAFASALAVTGLSATGLALGSGGAFAQGAGGSGGNLESAGQFRNITSTGVTKPPGSAAAPDTPVKPDERGKKRREVGPGIKGICIGCN